MVEIILGPVVDRGDPSYPELSASYEVQEERLHYLKNNNAIVDFSLLGKYKVDDTTLPPDEMLVAKVKLIPDKLVKVLKSESYRKNPELTVNNGKCFLQFHNGIAEVSDKNGQSAKLLRAFTKSIHVGKFPKYKRTTTIDPIFEALLQDTRKKSATSSNPSNAYKIKRIRSAIGELQSVLKKQGFEKRVSFKFIDKDSQRPKLKIPFD